jgi:hypothetical protein
MHVATTRRHYKGKVYQTHLLRRSYRQDGKVKHETLANLSHLPAEAIELVRRTLKGETFVAAADAFQVTRSLPHGHVALVWQAARQLGLPGLLGPRGRLRDLAMALVVARVVKPGSKLATTRWWADTTLAADLGVADASTDEVYAAMDWLAGRQDRIQRQLARRHLEPGGLALFDLSSSYVEGRHCELAARGYSRDQKVGKDQIEYGLLTDPQGRPVAVEVVAGNTADPTAFTKVVERIRAKFGLAEAAKVGVRIGKVLAKFKVAKHFDLQISDTTFTYARRGDQIAAEAALDGIYVVRTSVAADRLDPPGVVEAYKQLAGVERDFRSLKTIDLELRPIWHRLDGRVRAHVLMCMLACYLAWHLRRALAPLTFTDEQPRERPDPVAPAQRSADAAAKASRRQLADDTPAHSFRTLLDHLGTLVRDEVEFTDPTGATIHKLTSPTPTQRQAFELVGAPIPLALT